MICTARKLHFNNLQLPGKMEKHENSEISKTCTPVTEKFNFCEKKDIVILICTYQKSQSFHLYPCRNLEK